MPELVARLPVQVAEADFEVPVVFCVDLYKVLRLVAVCVVLVLLTRVCVDVHCLLTPTDVRQRDVKELLDEVRLLAPDCFRLLVKDGVHEESVVGQHDLSSDVHEGTLECRFKLTVNSLQVLNLEVMLTIYAHLNVSDGNFAKQHVKGWDTLLLFG